MEVKVTNKILRSYGKYKAEIRILQEEIYELEHTDAGLGNDIIFDYRQGFPKPQALVGRDKERIARRKEILRKRRQQVETVEKWVEDIEDAETRAVFHMRYIEQLNWIRIATKLKYSSEDYPRIRIRDKYLRECKLK